MNKDYFGTDGIRGRVGVFPITPDFVIQLGWAIGHYLSIKYPDGENIVVIGKDTRISGYMFESALQAGLVAAGVNVKLLGPMPTPAIAYMTRTQRARIGIVISASHNPYYDNGIKFFSEKGSKLDDEAELAIEACLKEPFITVSSENIGKVSRVSDAAGRYIEYCKGTVASGFSLQGKKLVVDCAHGATYHIAINVFKELGAEVIPIGVSPNGLNINKHVGSTAPELLQATVVKEQADYGIGFDGDGDRVVFVDQEGDVVDGDQLLYVIASAVDKTIPGFGGVIGTLMTNMGVELAFKDLGLDFVRSKVGDRYVKEAMIENGWFLGGESSGHIICADVSTTGDGIVSALKVLEAIEKNENSLTQILQPVKRFPQKMINVTVKDQSAACRHQEVLDAVNAVEKRLNGEGRVLLRPSGTEPVIRVMIEASDQALVDQSIGELVEVVKRAATNG